MRQSNEISVLFIAGSGRSGSTVLDRIAGTSRNFFSVGELRLVWERSYAHNHLCGCGKPFYECAFWKAVTEEAFGVGADQFDSAAAMASKEAVDRIRHVPWLTLRNRPASFQAKLNEYGELLRRLYSAIAHESGAKVIVDSSKDPTHGLLLSKLPGIQVHVVHLVRDPRAVAFSWKRKRRRPEIHWREENMRTVSVRTSAGRWLMHNTLSELLAGSATSYHRLRYEDFLADPEGAMAKILEPFRWAEKPTLKAGSEILLEPAHSVSGNPMRFEHGSLKLKLDDEWRSAMTRRDRQMVTAMTWPLLTRYGYSLRGAK